ncbi:GAF domain-containing protein [Chelativorans sp. EGI FJ00035]|uniref:GAF domain-containing protein n=2 Tax=Chelativorans salis TaxID=2978478 RepID=A0ABT2LWZ1_9HYPH|nr:GAF domain-containing protein [Chelativorans sp. EGI FJ00035]
MTDIDGALAAFDHALSLAKEPEAPFDALFALTQALVGAKLFTFTTVDMERKLARRAYTSDPKSYPASGTKPVRQDRWFEQVHDARRMFVANRLADIAKVFPDYALIGALGCGSVINLPVVLGDELVGTVNILHGEEHYTPERQALVEKVLPVPAKAAYLAGRYLSRG